MHMLREVSGALLAIVTAPKEGQSMNQWDNHESQTKKAPVFTDDRINNDQRESGGCDTEKKMWLKFEKYQPRHTSSLLRSRVKANTSQMPLEWQGELQSAVAVWVRHPGILFNRGGENFSSNFLLSLSYPVKMQFLTIQVHMILS